MSDSVRPHRQQPTRLFRPWDSPGKNTGVGCHFLLQCMKVKSEVAQSCPTLRDPWTAAHQAPPSMGFSRQEYWNGVPLPSPKTQHSKLIYVCAHLFSPMVVSLFLKAGVQWASGTLFWTWWDMFLRAQNRQPPGNPPHTEERNQILFFEIGI